MIALCKVSDVPLGEGRVVTVRGRRIALFHTPSGWFALDDACPHRGGPLSDGILSDRCVTCPLHDRHFELATGAALTDGEDVAAHKVELRGEIVLLLSVGLPGRADRGLADRGVASEAELAL